jgi:non-heme chloroperoxidase
MITEREQGQIDAANGSGRTPVVFVHGLWLLPNSWDSWAAHFEQAGFAPLTPGWPDDPDTVAEARANPDAVAGKTVGQIADHIDEVIRKLERKPAVVGHSFGGLMTEIVAGRGLAAVSVPISPVGFRGVLPLPVSALRVASVALSNPANRKRAVMLSYEQFRYGFANKVDEDEGRRLYDEFSVPGPGAVLFQAAAANLDPKTELKVDTKNPERGPMLLVGGDNDHTVPPSVVHAAFKKQHRNPGVTEMTTVPGRGHALTIDGRWQEVADTALTFVRRFVQPS